MTSRVMFLTCGGMAFLDTDSTTADTLVVNDQLAPYAVKLDILLWQTLSKLGFGMEAGIKKRTARCGHRNIQVVLRLEMIDKFL